MSDPLTPEIICLACKARIDPTDNYCRRCGAPTRGATGLSSRSRAGWWESPWFVLAMLFLVLGPLALPLLWRSRRFNRPWKILLSLIVMGVTVFVVGQIWYVFNRALAPLLELEKLQKL
jgi:drug/metabolite transporter (DMT)-like permease